MATRVKDVARRSSKKYVEEALYRRLYRQGSSAQAVRSEVDGFVDSRKRAFKWEVGVCVRRLRRQALYRPALKLAEVMARRGMNPTVSDQAIRLDLIAKSRGIVAAEKYFMDLPEISKNHLTYGALLNCYCKELMTQKAEALMEKMKELNFAFTALSYNSLMTLYTKINQPERVPGIIQDMKANDIMPDIYTYNVWMRALAAREDLSGVERVIEEMKRDGRVTPDWTTYSNLASIYVDAGLFQKAETALKELEKRNTSNDLGAYQFLITLYGRTQNLVEVHRVWRSLKRTHPKMANMSYLNMIRVLANLKDLPAAEACFKEWEARHIHPPKPKTKASTEENLPDAEDTKESESTKTSTEEGLSGAKGTEESKSTKNSSKESLLGTEGTKRSESTKTSTKEPERKHPEYDIRVANALIKAYIKEGMFDKAVALKKRAKMRGGRLNAKTWEIFMEHYLKVGDLKMAHWCADRALKKGRRDGRVWVPPRDVIETLMGYFEKEKDVDRAEKFVELLKKVQKDLGAGVFEPLVRTYAAAEKKFPGMRHRLKIENVDVSEETAKLLDSICVN